jgi:hypothetical protein
MSHIHLTALSYKELQDLEQSVARAKIIARAKEEAELRETCMAIIKQSGYTVAQLFGPQKKRRKSALN